MAYSRFRDRSSKGATILGIEEVRVAEFEGTWHALEKQTVGIRVDSRTWEQPAGANEGLSGIENVCFV